MQLKTSIIEIVKEKAPSTEEGEAVQKPKNNVRPELDADWDIFRAFCDRCKVYIEKTANQGKEIKVNLIMAVCVTK